MEAVFNDPADTLWRKVFNSIKNGIIDVPFSPHIINHNKMITIRDDQKNIRIIDRGSVPIPDRCFEYEKSCCDLDKDTTSNFKVSTPNSIEQHFRDFNKRILDDLLHKCGDTVQRFDPKDISICSSANGGLSALIIGLTESYSLKYAKNIAFNSGINIIDSIIFQDIEDSSIPSELIDVVIVVGGIDSNNQVFDHRLPNYLSKLSYSNVVYVGNEMDGKSIAAEVDR